MAARKFLVPISLEGYELQNAVIQNLAAAPSNAEGKLYYDTVNDRIEYYQGASAPGGAGWTPINPKSLWATAGTWTAAQAFNAAITGNNTINLTGTGASGVGGLFGAVGFSNTGLSGAATATRYVGGTASGAPASGTFVAGDFIITTGGDVWICTTGGTPGTWSRVGSYLLGTANTWTANQTFNTSILGNGTIALTGTGASSVGGTFTATALVSSGLTGATQASRYVGATTSGAPSAGTFVQGDFIVARDGAIWVCTVNGSPGTWVQIGASGTIYNQNIKANNGTALTQRNVINFINGTFTTATAVDNASQSDIKFDVSVAAPTSSQTFGSANAAGSATTLARSDHTHSFPAQNTFALSGFGAPTADVGWGGFKITGLGTPSAATDAATKGYVDTAIQGLDWKASVRAVVTTNGTLASAYQNGSSAGGVTLATGDRILLAGQTTASENGIYTVNATGAPTRATDADASGEISVGTVVPIEAGTNANAFFYCTATGANPWVPGSSTSTWSYMFTVTATQAGAGLTATGNVLAVGAGTGIVVNADDVAVNRTGTAGAHVPLLYWTETHSSATSIAITHNLGNQRVIAQVYEIATNALVECDVVQTSTTQTTFIFAAAPTSNTLRFVIYG